MLRPLVAFAFTMTAAAPNLFAAGRPTTARVFFPSTAPNSNARNPAVASSADPGSGPDQAGQKPLCVDDRPVIDKTGLADLLNVHLEYMPDNAPPTDNPDGAPTLFTALAQLGLKLDPSHAGRDFLVIDRLERPNGN